MCFTKLTYIVICRAKLNFQPDYLQIIIVCLKSDCTKLSFLCDQQFLFKAKTVHSTITLHFLLDGVYVQGKKLLARNEKEATLADLQMAKMQVDATDAAENKKKHIHDS